MQLTDIYTTNEFKDCWIYIEMPPENQLEILSLVLSKFMWRFKRQLKRQHHCTCLTELASLCHRHGAVQL